MKRFILYIVFCALVLAPLFGCAGVRASQSQPLATLRTDAVLQAGDASFVGYTNGSGVPSMAERFQERPNLKVAILQVSYLVQGAPEMKLTEDWNSYNAGYSTITTWTEVTVPEIEVPAKVVYGLSLDSVAALEAALSEAGFQVIPFAEVGKTTAYKKWYGDYPYGYALSEGMHAGYTISGAPPFRTKPVTSIFNFGTTMHIWPDAEAMQEIAAELGEDVLFLTYRHQLDTYRVQGKERHGLVGGFASLVVNDPKFAGYGFGGYGHTVTAIELGVDSANQPDFIENLDNQFRVRWEPVFADGQTINRFLYGSFAKQLAVHRDSPQ